MKFISTQLSFFLTRGRIRQNIRALLAYILFLVALVALYSVLFHFIMLYAEGREHTWLTGLYWTLTVMSTLGFGDITFESDIGRLFSIVVLISGVVFLLIVLPFTFISYFYAPWLESRLRLQAPRAVPPETSGHIIICRYDSLARAFIKKLEANRIPYFVIESDPATAIALSEDGVSVVAGDIETRATYERMRAGAARMVLANTADTTNANITLTVREVSADVPIITLVENEDSIDILELSGATHVIPLKHRLGEQLANRINAGRARAHIIGRLKELFVAEFPVQDTSFAGQSIRETRLRETTGLNVVGVWERGRLLSALPGRMLSDFSVPVVVGTKEQLAELDAMLAATETNSNMVLIIGGGKVGYAAARALKQQGVRAHFVERDERLRECLSTIADHVEIGDAADREVLMRAGLEQAPSVILSTNDDAVNIYLSIYCRRLNPDLRIVSRITHERNLEAIHRAGADFVLSYSFLGAKLIFSLMLGRDPVMLGEGVDFFLVSLPPKLAGKSLAESRIGERTGLIVIAIQDGEHSISNPPPATKLAPGNQLLLLGTAEQRQVFAEEFS